MNIQRFVVLAPFAAMTLNMPLLLAQNPQQLSVLSGTALAAGLNLGINTSGGLTNWLTVEPPSIGASGDLKMVCPSEQAWCAMFITDGPAISTYPRPGIDLSGYQTLSVEIEGDPGTTVQVGIKDSSQRDDGTEPKVTVPVTSNWTTLTIPLSRFSLTKLTSVYLLCEFVFSGGPQPQTVRVRNITYANSTTTYNYYFSHLAFGGSWQTTFTYLNYSQQNVNCQTTFYSDSGSPLTVPFANGSSSSRTDNLPPGGSSHAQTKADANSAQISGWAVAQCNGAIKASLLFRLYNGGVAQGEATVNASSAPATEFVTFAETQTGIAYANASTVPASITITALDATGAKLGSKTLVVQPNAHGSANIGPLLGLSSFTGSVQITSTVPIVSLSLNAEAFPVFSSLPPGDLPDGTPLP